MTSLPRWSPDMVDGAVGRGLPVLVDLQAEWCGQCEPQERVVQRLAADYPEVAFVAVDLGEHPAFPDRYGVRGLPALLLFSGGTLRHRFAGFTRAPLIRRALDTITQPESRPTRSST